MDSLNNCYKVRTEAIIRSLNLTKREEALFVQNDLVLITARHLSHHCVLLFAMLV